jgi:hypothetical protein
MPVYAQLTSSFRVPVDENYQSLLNVKNYEQPDKYYYNENVQGNLSMSMDTNPRYYEPDEHEIIPQCDRERQICPE